MADTATVINQRGAPFEIDADGIALDPSTSVVEIRIEQSVGLADRAILRLADPDFTITDGDTLKPGTTLTVKLGASHTDDRATQLFNGEVVTLEAEMGASGVHVLAIALDKSHRMRRHTRTKAYNNVTVGDVARQVASSSGLEASTIEDTGPPRELIFQDGESDWQLLERLFDEEGCDLNFVGGKLAARKRSASGSPLELTLGTTLRSFHPRLSGAAQVDSVEVRSWDPSQKQPISETSTPTPAVSSQSTARTEAASALGGGALVLVDHPAESSGVAKVIATAVANSLAAQVIEATGVALGDPAITAGSVVTLSGVGTRFGGEHRVVAATHVLRGSVGYETRFTLGSGGRPLARELQRSQRAGGFAAHLAIGLVTQNDDTSNQARIKVKFPVLDEVSESGWIRVACPAAGSNRGIIALPSIGDEVIIGFEHGDITRPVMLGALYNGVDTPGAALPSPVTPQTVAITVPGDVITTATGNVNTSAEEGLSTTSKGPVTVAAQGDGPLKLTSTGPMELASRQTLKLGATATTTLQCDAEVQITSNLAVQIKAATAIELSALTITLNARGALILKGSSVVLG